jgi:D-3-phosphoglycerate dehydrogenase
MNVEHMINKARGDIAYTIIDVGSPVTEEITEKIAAIPQVRRVRAL